MARMARTLLLAALGGALGSGLRAGVGLALPFPWATLGVNVLGSFLMGWLFAALAPAWHPLVLAGLLGGFTTFSAFSLDALRLVEAGRPGLAALYAGGSVALSLGACAAGLALGRAA